MKSLAPWKKDFFQGLGEKPDLYGPFWIVTTIIFLLSLTGNLSRYLNNLGESDFTFRMELFRYSVIIGYSFGFGFPILLGLLLRFFNSKIGVFDLICLYGYSLTCFVLILVLCVIPVGILHWILIGYGIVNSCVFLVLNVKEQIDNLEPFQRYIVFGLTIAVQIVLFLLFKLVFFNMIFE